MKQYQTARSAMRTPRHKRGAFTLVEVLVALAVMMVMMTIILVPINMGLNVFNIGKTRSEVQQANRLVVNQLVTELKQAVHVFPNEEMMGITNLAPYLGAPYYDSVTSTRVSNTARLDFLLPEVTDNGSILAPPVANTYLVTYYARRLKAKKDDDVSDNPYDVFTNPVVLWRAQYPFRPKTSTSPVPEYVANLTDSRYSDWTNNSNKWLIQERGEPNLDLVLEPGTKPNVTYTNQPLNVSTVSASHTQITPRDMALVAPNAGSATSYQPDSSFICNDSNADNKIDQVTINFVLAKYDSSNAAGDKPQQIRSIHTVSLPNIR